MPTFKVAYWRSFFGSCYIDAKDEDEARAFFENYDPDDSDYFNCGDETRIDEVTEVFDE